MWFFFLTSFHCSTVPKTAPNTMYIFTSSFRHTAYPFFTVPKIHKEIGRRSFRYKAPSDWSNLLSILESITSFFSTFTANVFSHLRAECPWFLDHFLLYFFHLLFFLKLVAFCCSWCFIVMHICNAMSVHMIAVCAYVYHKLIILRACDVMLHGGGGAFGSWRGSVFCVSL